MSCPRCGEVCRCDPDFRVALSKARSARPRFELDAGERATPVTLIDPEAYDASEETFSASLESCASPAPRFVLEVEQAETESELQSAGPCPPELSEEHVDGEPQPPVVNPSAETETAPATEQTDVPELPAGVAAGPESWKDEVAARLNSYRARRKPKPPRYPSLRLKFDSPEQRTYARVEGTTPAPLQDNLAPAECEPQEPLEPPVPEPRFVQPVETARIIEFPRSLYAPTTPTYELAEPVIEAPRILEVPDLAPPPPALGGISLPAEEKEPERRPGFEIPLQTPPLSRRVFAMFIDTVIVGVAATLFAYIVIKIGGAITFSLPIAETFAAVLAIMMGGYQYLLLTYSGSTPGLRLANLRLTRFDGSPVPRRLRQWRVLASMLSAVSLGLGFAWSYLDEDALCWHDRITRTYLAPLA